MNIAGIESRRSSFAGFVGALLLGCLLSLGGSACSSTQPSDGAGGTSGGSGPAGGRGGTGGVGPAPVMCTGPSAGNAVELTLVGPNGMPVEAPVTAAVTVASVESCAATACPSPATTAASKIVLADASQQQWTLYLRNPSMPSTLVEAGGAFDLIVDASVDTTFYRTINQTVVLARGGDLIVFAASLRQFFGVRVPSLSTFGIQIADEGTLCERYAVDGCNEQRHGARVSVGGDSALIAGGETKTVGWLTVSNAQFTVLSICDAKSPTVMAGFRQ